MRQKTISQTVTLEGVGVHTGSESILTLKPAPPNSGIIFQHKHIPNEPLHIGTIVPQIAMHATVLKGKSWGISTIEHLMAAIHGLGIDNMLIEIDGFEPPILDGSALPFVHAIQGAGIEEQDAQKQFLTPKKKLTFTHDDRYIEITPAKDTCELSFDYSVDFEHPLVTDKKIEGSISSAGENSSRFFIEEIAPARTFGFLEQLPLLRKHGLAQGTTLGNTVVVGEESFLNSKRFEDEFIRHKLLDLIGDLALLGKPLAGAIKAHKTGHSFNRNVVEHYLNNPDEWVLKSI